LTVKVKIRVPLLRVCAILPAKAVPEMTYTVSGGTLNPTHSLGICDWLLLVWTSDITLHEIIVLEADGVR